MLYDDEIEDRRQRFPLEDAAEAARMQREARTAFAQAAKAMRRKVAVAPVPTSRTIERSGVVLEPAGVFLSRREIERMAAKIAAEYCAGTLAP